MLASRLVERYECTFLVMIGEADKKASVKNAKLETACATRLSIAVIQRGLAPVLK